MTQYHMGFYPLKYETPQEAKNAGELKITGSDMTMGYTQFMDMFEAFRNYAQVSGGHCAYCICNSEGTEFYDVEDID